MGWIYMLTNNVGVWDNTEPGKIMLGFLLNDNIEASLLS